MDSQLDALSRQVEKCRAYNAGLRELTAAREAVLATVLASDRSTGPNVQEFELRTSLSAKIREADRLAPAWQQTIEMHQAVLKAASADPRRADLEAGISEFSSERAELLRLRARLAAIPEKLRR